MRQIITSLNLRIAISLLMLCCSSFAAAEDRDPALYFFQDSFNDLSEEAMLAAEEGKVGVLVIFETNDCPWCERMKETVLNQPEVQDYFRRHFRVIALNTDGDALVTDFDGVEVSETAFALQHNRIRATPAFLFFDTEGQLLTRFTGTTRDPQEFLWLGEYVVEAHFHNERFSSYKRNRRKEPS
ncbi:MAG: thioredoxin fold domain-containing protein [Proteobacteria bacterium]|nr:thioredoxin fold domain-containing protein [Pseudomonadota bacterium]